MKKTLASAAVSLLKQSGEIALRELIREKVRSAWKKRQDKKSDKVST